MKDIIENSFAQVNIAAYSNGGEAIEAAIDELNSLSKKQQQQEIAAAAAEGAAAVNSIFWIDYCAGSDAAGAAAAAATLEQNQNRALDDHIASVYQALPENGLLVVVTQGSIENVKLCSSKKVRWEIPHGAVSYSPRDSVDELACYTLKMALFVQYTVCICMWMCMYLHM